MAKFKRRLGSLTVLLLAAGCGDGVEQTSNTEPADPLSAAQADLQLPQAFPGAVGELHTEVLKLPGLEKQEITYELFDGRAVFQGDIEFDLEAARRDASDDDVSRGTGRSNEAARWLDGKIPFLINGTVNGADPRVDSAILHWQSLTPIRFVRRTTEADYINIVTTGTGCSSYAGRKGGGQTLQLEMGCSIGNAIHELGHAVGLWHEQMRVDAEKNHININWSNIKNDFKVQFKPYTAGAFGASDGFDNRSFDFRSIMLYPSFNSAAINTAVPTMTKKGPFCGPSTPTADCTWSRGNSLSDGDIQAVGRMYPRLQVGAMPALESFFGAGVTSWAPEVLDVVAVDTNLNLRHQFFENGVWSGWIDDWGGPLLIDKVDVASWGFDRLDVVGIGINGSLWHFWYEHGPIGWEDLNKQCKFAPTIASQEFSSLDVFCIGTDNQLWHKPFRPTTGWGAWTPRGGVLTTSADAVASKNRIDLVSRNSWNRMVHMNFNGTSWNGWVDMSGSLTSRPTVASWQPGHMDIFAEAQDGNLWKRSYQGNWEINWTQVAGVGMEADAVSWGPGAIDVIVLDPNTGLLKQLFAHN